MDQSNSSVLQTSDEQPAHPEDQKRKIPKPFLILLFVLPLAALFLAWYVIFSQIKTQEEKLHTSTSSPTPTAVHAQPIAVPQFREGKVAFVRNGNIWVAQEEGVAKALTNDAIDTSGKGFVKNYYYSLPTWSPDGKTLAFMKRGYGYENTGETQEISKLFFFNGSALFSLNNNDEQVSTFKPPYWVSPKAVLLNYPPVLDKNTKTFSNIASVADIEGEKVMATDTTFPNLVNPDGCGGGGRPAWLTALSNNHDGGLDGVRNTLIYLKNPNTLIYSSGCEQEIVYSTTGGKSTRFGPAVGKSMQELLLSHDKTQLVGVLVDQATRDVAIFALDGKLIKQLTTGATAFGPVFSPDGRTIYYADNVGEKVALKEVSITGGIARTVYASPHVGAISNINFSPDGYTVLFTRIDQLTPVSEDGADPGEIAQSLYTISTEGGDAHLFLQNASQGAWGK